MKINLSIVLAAVIMSSIIIPPIFANQNPLNAQQPKPKNKKVKVPPPPTPPSRGFPGNRSVSASMSSNSCELNLVALAPQFSQNTASQISETSVWGQTTLQYPTFWFFIPATPASTKIEFSLQDGEEDIYRTNIPIPQQPGITFVQIPSSQPPLQLNRHYRWTLKAKLCDETSTPRRIHVDGWVTRVNLPATIMGQNTSEIYATNGIWYDAVTSLAQQRLQQPQDVQLAQDWSDLLESVNLTAISKQPLVRGGG
jgi:hypothetical protein